MLVWETHLLFHGTQARLEFGPDTRATGLPIGCLVAVSYSSRAWPWLRNLARLALPLAICVVVVVAYRAPQPRAFAGWNTLFAGACAVILVCALDSASRIARALSARPLVGLGRISYSLYLWHLPILAWLGWEMVGGIRATVGVALSVVTATFSYYFVEKPFLHRRPVARAVTVAIDHSP